MEGTSFTHSLLRTSQINTGGGGGGGLGTSSSGLLLVMQTLVFQPESPGFPLSMRFWGGLGGLGFRVLGFRALGALGLPGFRALGLTRRISNRTKTELTLGSLVGYCAPAA